MGRIPKLRQKNKNVPAIVKNTKKYLYDRRLSLTEDEINNLINHLAERLLDFGYSEGWNKRNEIYRICKGSRFYQTMDNYNDFFNKYADKIPVSLMEEIRSLVYSHIGSNISE